MKKSVLITVITMLTFAGASAHAKCVLSSSHQTNLVNANKWILQAEENDLKVIVSLSPDTQSVTQMRIKDLSLGTVIISDTTAPLSSLPTLTYEKNGQTFNLICGN